MRGGDFLAAGGALAATVALPARAAYPDKPVRYIIAFAPGGESDIAARLPQAVWRGALRSAPAAAGLAQEVGAGAGGRIEAGRGWRARLVAAQQLPRRRL